MSILSVDNISPIGSGTSVTVNSAATLVLTNANSTGVVTATTFSGSGASLTNLPAGQLTGTVADARITTLTASKLTGALPAIDGSNLTGISAGGSGDYVHISTTNITSATNSVEITLPTGYDGMESFGYNTDMNCEIGCTDPDASNYNSDAILDDGSCVLFGCTITAACNYNPDATAFDGSCYYCYMDDCNTYPSEYYDCDGYCVDAVSYTHLTLPTKA